MENIVNVISQSAKISAKENTGTIIAKKEISQKMPAKINNSASWNMIASIREKHTFQLQSMLREKQKHVINCIQSNMS